MGTRVATRSRIRNPYTIPDEWGLTDALIAHPGLQLVPAGGDEVLLRGEFAFAATARRIPIEDSYCLEIRIPRTYPSKGFPRVFEKAGRIPGEYHHLADGSLCLGAATRLRRIALRTPSVSDFLTLVVVPYLYARSYFERFGRMPFGELAHGSIGLAQDLIEMLRMPPGTSVSRLVKSASLRRRHANKRPCPCGSGTRLGKCHNQTVNAARVEFGRRWFAGQWQQLFAPTASERVTALRELHVMTRPSLRAHSPNK